MSTEEIIGFCSETNQLNEITFILCLKLLFFICPNNVIISMSTQRNSLLPTQHHNPQQWFYHFLVFFHPLLGFFVELCINCLWWMLDSNNKLTHFGHSCHVILMLCMSIHFLTSFDPGFERLSDKLPWSASTNLFWCKEDTGMTECTVCMFAVMKPWIVLSMLTETVKMHLIKYVGSGFGSVVKMQCFASLLRLWMSMLDFKNLPMSLTIL